MKWLREWYYGKLIEPDNNGVTFRNRCDVLEIAATTRREVARFAVSCQVTLAAIKFGFRPDAGIYE